MELQRGSKPFRVFLWPGFLVSKAGEEEPVDTRSKPCRRVCRLTPRARS